MDIASMVVRELPHPTIMSRVLPVHVLALLLPFGTGSFSFIQSHRSTTFRMRAAAAAAAAVGTMKLRMATNNNNNNNNKQQQ
jgi:hypothetical protein